MKVVKDYLKYTSENGIEIIFDFENDMYDSLELKIEEQLQSDLEYQNLRTLIRLNADIKNNIANTDINKFIKLRDSYSLKYGLNLFDN